MTAIRHARLPLQAAGLRLDQALAELFPDYSRTRLTAWLRAGAVRIDGTPAAPRLRVRGGEQVSIDVPEERAVPLAPEPIALDLRHVDVDLLVLVKPAGLVVHPGAGNPAGTLQNALLHFDPELAALPRAGIVHRLDKDTSGLLVVARSLRAHTALTTMIATRAVSRQYAAIVRGALIAGGEVRAAIGRHPQDRQRQTVRDGAAGKPALTHYRVRERFRAHTLLQCNLETGRTHQIRVHMAHLGHPLVGDPLYGGGLKLPRGASPALVVALRGFGRQALHAERLAFTHPISGESLQFEATPPADFLDLLVTLRADALADAD